MSAATEWDWGQGPGGGQGGSWTHSGVKSDGRHKVNVLEAAETLPPGDVPQPHRLVHGGGEQEEVLQHKRERGGGLEQGFSSTGAQPRSRSRPSWF